MPLERFLKQTCRTLPAAAVLVLLLSCGSGSPAAARADGDEAPGQTTQARPRPPAVAGTFYPGDPEVLRRTVRGLLDRARRPEDGTAPRAAVVPHAGYVFSGECAAAVYRALEGRDIRLVIVLGPSHRSGFAGIALTGATGYLTPLGEMPVDEEALRRLRASGAFRDPHPAEAPEHGIEVQIPFLQIVAPNARLVPLLVGQIGSDDIRAAARVLAPFLDDRTVLLASCDFTHYGPRFGYVPFTRDVRTRLYELDSGAIERILALDPGAFLDYQRRTGATICGRYPVAVLLETLRERYPGSVRAEVVSRYTSADVMGDEENSVSYVGIVFRDRLAGKEGNAMREESEPLDAGEQAFLLRLARETLDRVVGHRASPPRPDTAQIPARLIDPGKAFVSLKEQGELRGCIGSLEAVGPLYESVIHNAVNAATRDTRFPPVRPEELEAIEIEISVMSPNRPIPDADHFEVGLHGIILEKEGRRAVFLPQVAPEQGWDREQTLAHLCMKAGLPPDAWRQGASFEVFTAQVFGEHSAR